MSADPFKGRGHQVPAPMTVLYRFTKPGHVAEIRERKVTQFRALEFLVFVDDQLSESQMFHGARVAEYPDAIAARLEQFKTGGWREQPATVNPVEVT